jgi:hypothetical protein
MMHPISSAVTIRSKNWRGAIFAKDATKKLFSEGFKITCEALEPVR